MSGTFDSSSLTLWNNYANVSAASAIQPGDFVRVNINGEATSIQNPVVRFR
ncbi:MAG: hypothetical protein KGI08_11500 [Thaumarchaeota archaeon]|nr:hypothetical protein [Nitrososphaerota archaeon]